MARSTHTRNADRTPLDQLIEKERWDHLNGLLSDFTEKDRTFVELYYQKGLEADEIAAEMQISLKTVVPRNTKFVRTSCDV